MSFLSSLGGFFKKLGKVVGGALEAAGAKGLTDALVSEALQWAKVAALNELNNGEKREFVVNALVKKGVPESLARLATELAVQLLKKEAHAVGL